MLATITRPSRSLKIIMTFMKLLLIPHLDPRLLLESIDQSLCTGIVVSGLPVQLRLDLLCQRLAKLNTPLVEAVDVPYGPLREGQVLVIDN